MTEQPQLTIAECAKEVILKMESGDHSGALLAVEDLNRARDHALYHEIGKLTRHLHDAIVNFEIETHSGNVAPDGKPVSRIHDASDRLQFVISTTENAANKTMDMVEETIPISDELGQKAKALRNDWKRLLNREMTVGEFRELYKQIDTFLEFTESKATNINSNLTSILIAQDFQDITGQVLKKVITLVHEVEDNLVGLVKMASSLQGFTTEKLDAEPEEIKAHKEYLEGPIVNADERQDVVSNQDEVDDLLSSLGF
jgi:chemotaxis protein CheZ